MSFPNYPILLRYKDGNDCDLFIAADSSDLREMEVADVEEGAWDGWDSGHNHFTVAWDYGNGDFVLKESHCEDSLENVQAEYERVYKVVSEKGQRFRLDPSLTYAWIGDCRKPES